VIREIARFLGLRRRRESDPLHTKLTLTLVKGPLGADVSARQPRLPDRTRSSPASPRKFTYVVPLENSCTAAESRASPSDLRLVLVGARPCGVRCSRRTGTAIAERVASLATRAIAPPK